MVTVEVEDHDVWVAAREPSKPYQTTTTIRIVIAGQLQGSETGLRDAITYKNPTAITPSTGGEFRYCCRTRNNRSWIHFRDRGRVLGPAVAFDAQESRQPALPSTRCQRPSRFPKQTVITSPFMIRQPVWVASPRTI